MARDPHFGDWTAVFIGQGYDQLHLNGSAGYRLLTFRTRAEARVKCRQLNQDRVQWSKLKNVFRVVPVDITTAARRP